MSINLRDEVRALKSTLIERRRDFHRHPELAFQEQRTAGIVASVLGDLGLEVQTEIGKTGVVGLLEGDHDGPTLLVRADMDALPIHEQNQTDYASQVDGVMHACGHDGHTSIGLAVAQVLAGHRPAIKGRVKFVFQPAEEIGEGAAAMISDGVLEAPRPDYSIGLHLWNDLPVGKVGVTPGPCMAAADIWKCTITGYGGHGAAPHTLRDPILTAAQVITAMQGIVGRNVNPLDAAVVSVGSIHGGETFNVIPPRVELVGTIRTYREETRAMVGRRLGEICEGVAGAMQCEAELDIRSMSPAVDNDPQLADRIAAIAARHVGAEHVEHDIRTMGSEDMAFLMDDIPGCYFFIGSANAGRDLSCPHHNPHFDFDEEALVIGAAILAEAAASFVMPED